MFTKTQSNDKNFETFSTVLERIPTISFMDDPCISHWREHVPLMQFVSFFKPSKMWPRVKNIYVSMYFRNTCTIPSGTGEQEISS